MINRIRHLQGLLGVPGLSREQRSDLQAVGGSEDQVEDDLRITTRGQSLQDEEEHEACSLPPQTTKDLWSHQLQTRGASLAPLVVSLWLLGRNVLGQVCEVQGLDLESCPICCWCKEAG